MAISPDFARRYGLPIAHLLAAGGSPGCRPQDEPFQGDPNGHQPQARALALDGTGRAGRAAAASRYPLNTAPLTWTERQKLIAIDSAAGDFFGSNVALSADTALLGASGDDGQGTDSGSAYVFTRNADNWTQRQKLSPGDGAASDAFGSSVAMSADTILIGAYGGGFEGSAYIFKRTADTWAELQKLSASDPEFGDRFGFSVALSADTAVVGAYADDSAAGDDSGSAYVFALRLVDGENCGSAVDCASMQCVDGVCCDNLCDDTCEACDIAGTEDLHANAAR